ncbi:MAG: hypothetical protein C4547_15205 [Phycisphaerales bacterium]|nr:MAG: hypothetical protein C4547_15205 [Phycisphaerales bacterium]
MHSHEHRIDRFIGGQRMEFTRREFLIAGGVSGALAAQGWAVPQVIYAGAREGQADPLERTVMTLCRQCSGGCGLKVRVIRDCVVGIAGNPIHPINRGGVCPGAPAAVQSLYNPDRLTQPLVLAGPKGAGRYQPVSWTEAVRQLAARLRDLRRTTGPHGLAVITRGDRGLKRLLLERFLQAYGSNNLIDGAAPDAHQAYPAIRAVQGFPRAVGYDLAQTRYVLSFGSQWLDAHWSPAQAGATFAALRGRDQDDRRRFVHVEPRLSLTAAKADEWIPARPGTEGALALGLAHVIVREGLYDRAFVERMTDGFEDPDGGRGGRIGFRRLVLRDYAPSRVSRITGVEEGTIFRLAREFTAQRPALAIGYDGASVSTQRTYDRMAIHALNALVGSIDVAGGVTHFRDIELLNLPVPEPDGPAEAGLSKPRIDVADPSVYPLADCPTGMLAERILADLPYPIEVLVLAGGNPVFDSPHPQRVQQALGKVPLVVSLSSWMDDSARWADLIIPDAHSLSSWDVDLSHTLTGRPVVTTARPVVPASAEARGSAELILELARELGDPVSRALPFPTAQAAVRAVCDTLAASGRGGAFGPLEQEGWIRLLERGGWRPPAARSQDEFYTKVIAAGGWSDPIYYDREWDRVFRSPPRRFAFHSALIAQHVKPRNEADDVRCLPHYQAHESGEPNEAFPYRLYVYPLAVLAGMKDVNIPWLMDASGRLMRQRWNTWVEINPRTAHKLDIADGDVVTVASSRGTLRLHAKLFEGIMPEVLAIPYGFGHEGGGRWCEKIGQNPATLVDVEIDPLTGGPLWNSTRVALRKT